MENAIGCLATAGVSFYIAFWMARGCLAGVIRLVTGPSDRNVLSSQP